MQTNSRIERLTREALGDARADDVKSSVASIEVMVVATLTIAAAAIVYSLDTPVSSPTTARLAPAAGIIEVGHTRPAALQPSGEGDDGTDRQTEHGR